MTIDSVTSFHPMYCTSVDCKCQILLHGLDRTGPDCAGPDQTVYGLVGDPLGPNGRRNESATKSGRARLVEFGHNLVAPLVRFVLDFVVQLVPIQLCSGWRVFYWHKSICGSGSSCYRAMLCMRGTSHGPVSVCLCLSVTSWCSTKTAKRRIT